MKFYKVAKNISDPHMGLCALKGAVFAFSEGDEFSKEYFEEMPFTSRHSQESVIAMLDMIQRDNHGFSKRPCQTCRAITGILGEKWGCEKIN